MRLIRSTPGDTCHQELKKKFAAFNQTRPKSKGRRYPAELRQLVEQAGAEGMRRADLLRLTGLSATALSRWLASPAEAKPRRLEVVDQKVTAASSAVLIRL